MKTLVHLHVEEILLLPGQEWMDAAAAWHLVRVTRGAAYWLGPGRSRSLVEGEVLVIPPAAEGLVRASQINEVLLHGFNFAPDLLCGFLTLTERHYFEQVSGQPPGEVRFLPTTHAAAERFAALAAAAPAARGLARRVETLNILAAVFDEEIARHRMPASRSTSAGHRFVQLITRMPDLELINHAPDELAQLCGCSPRHFNRLFHKQFGTSARARQTELRLLKARQLLCGSDAKIIQVALDCGYRNLGLFNSLFKRRFGLTPSECRQKAAKETGKARSLIAGLALLLLGSAAGLGAGKPDAAPPAAPSTNAPVFAVRGYELQGNTLLAPSITGPLFQPHTGPAVSLDSIRQALADLKMAYHNRGYVTVAVTLPPQRLTNGIVTVQVTEGRLAEINVLNNHYFTSNNVMRELPCLHTNLILNALIFQQELDRANANRDRQIYPVLSPGPSRAPRAWTSRSRTASRFTPTSS